MKLFLFAIGGTGARIVRSLTMMLSSGIKGLDSSTEIVPIIIDYDKDNGDKKRATDSLDSYCNIHHALCPDDGAVYNDHFFMTRITPLSQVGTAPTTALDFEFNFKPTGTNSQKFSEYLDMNTMEITPDIRITRDLLHVLYDDSDNNSPSAELELDMGKGFKGNPNIGSVVFHELRTREEFTRFVGACNATVGDKIFIVSSIFGGTGASGLPEIVKAIRSSNKANLNNVVIGATLVMPYFGLQPFDPTKGNGDTGAIDAASFNAKTRAALLYYAQNNELNDLVNAIYYVGDNYRDQYEYNEGTGRQKNDAHVVEFVAASSILDFLINRNNVTSNNHFPYEFGIADARTESQIELFDFYQPTYNLLLDSMSSFAIAMKYYRDVTCGDRNKVSDDTGYAQRGRFELSSRLGRGVFQEVDNFLQNKDWGYYHWLEELSSSGHEHKLSPYIMDKTKKLQEVLSHNNDDTKVKKYKKYLDDDDLSGEMNKKSKKAPDYSDCEFFKELRDVAAEAYNKVR